MFYLKFDYYEIFKAVLVLIIGFGASYLYKIWASYRFFKKRGIKTPEYEFIYGNFRQLRNSNNASLVLQKWTEKFGKTYGVYEGHLPILITSDLEIIKEVFVKQSTNFSARKKSPINLKDDSKLHNLFGATKSKWKMMRSIMNPTFSFSKLRELNPLLLTCVDRLTNILQDNVKKEIDVSCYLKRFTMDSIWNCAFGYDIDAQHKLENKYFDKCEQVFSDGVKLKFIDYIGVCIHEIKEVLLEFLIVFYTFASKFLDDDSVSPYFWLNTKITDVVKKYQEDSEKRRNYIALLLEANQTNSPVKETSGDVVDYTKTRLEKFLNIDEIHNNLTLFLLAGYETTSSSLTYAMYVLANHPDEQQILIDEIDSFYSNSADDQPNSDNINNLNYLDMFVKETLRLYPIANSVVARRCTNATNVCGMDIPLDLAIQVDVMSLHMDPEIWGPQDPKLFYPQRFSPEIKRNNLAFMAFGQGPRNCIGMKFAIIEMKLAIIKIVQKFEVCKSENTPVELEFVEGFVRLPSQPVKVMFKERKPK